MMMLSIPRPFSLKGSEKKIVKAIDALDITRSDNLDFIDPAAVKVAAIPMKLRSYRKLDDLVEHCNEKMSAAAHSGAQLVVFPELIGLAPLLMVPKYERHLSDYKLCEATDRPAFTLNLLDQYYGFLQEIYFTLFSELACQYGVYVQAGSLYLYDGDLLYNRAYLFDPDGDVSGYQDKLSLSEEEVALGVAAGRHLELIETKVGKACIAIGQDSLYFEIYRIAKGLGAQMMLCPACNLHYGCRGSTYADAYLRVQETSLFAVKATLNGDLLQRRFGGASGIYCPASLAEEKQGILAGSENDPERIQPSRINLNKLDLAFNPYYCDSNEEFSAEFSALHYGEADARPHGAPALSAAASSTPSVVIPEEALSDDTP